MEKDGIRVTLAYAQSIDGRIATKTGDSQWISGNETLILSQELRKNHEAIAVGINTVLRDDPLLTCRLPNCRNPLRIVFDSRLRLPPSCQIAATAFEVGTLVFCDADELVKPETERRSALLRNLGITVQGLSSGKETGGPGKGLSLRDALDYLSGLGMDSLLVEGGAALLTAFLLSGFVRKVVVVTAPLLIGRGVEAVGDLAVEKLADAVRPKRAGVRILGEDVVWELEL